MISCYCSARPGEAHMVVHSVQPAAASDASGYKAIELLSKLSSRDVCRSNSGAVKARCYLLLTGEH